MASPSGEPSTVARVEEPQLSMDPQPSPQPSIAPQPSKASLPLKTFQPSMAVQPFTPFISALPNEILLEIFYCHVAMWSIFNSGKSLPVASKWHGWMPIACVCKRWCAVVLHAPALWRTIYAIEPLKPLEAYLTRSKNVPLSVIIAPHKGTTAAWSLVLTHAHRVETLFFDCEQFTGEALATLMRGCKLEFPHLKRLNFRGPTDYRTAVTLYGPEAWPPLAFRSGEVLEIFYTPFVKSFQLFCRTLRQLTLSRTTWGPSHRLPSPLAVTIWKAFLETLGTLHSLQELRVLNNPPPFPNDLQLGGATEHTLGTPPVVLPRLQLLEVSSQEASSAQQAELLVTHISAPAGIAIHVTLSPLPASKYTRLVSTIGAELLRGGASCPPKVLRTLIIERVPSRVTRGLTHVTATGWHDVDTPLAELARRPWSAQSHRPLFTISIPCPVDRGGMNPGLFGYLAACGLTAPEDALDTVCTELPLGGLERFALASWPLSCESSRDRELDAMFESERANAPPGMIGFFESMVLVDRLPRPLALEARALRVLDLSGPFAPWFVDDFAPGAGDAEPDFPNLEELHLARFGESQVARRKFKSLAKSLEKRRAMPAKNLRRLVLDDPEVDDDAAALLKDVVEELTCIRRNTDESVQWRRTFHGGSESGSQKL